MRRSAWSSGCPIAAQPATESLSWGADVLYSFRMAELPTAYPLRDLFDAAARGRNVKLTCTACGHVTILSGAAL